MKMISGVSRIVKIPWPGHSVYSKSIINGKTAIDTVLLIFSAVMVANIMFMLSY